MCDIDEIMDMFDWNNDIEKQQHGLELAQDIKCINAFLQPGTPYGKSVWENCAKVLCARSDDELRPYLIPLFEWLQDLNWPGALLIYERIKSFPNDKSLEFSKNECINRAIALNDEIWLNNILSINNIS